MPVMSRRTVTAAVPGGDLVGWVQGTGPPVLLLHGGPGLSFTYGEGLTAELGDAFTLASYQQRGLAPSTTDGPFTVGRQVEDAVAVLDALGWERAHLLGVSMGAGMAQFLALLHPGRVRSLTLISGIPMGGSPLGMLRYMHLGAFAKLATRRYGPARQDQERMLVDVLRATCTDRYPLDEAWARRTATVSYDRRPPDPAARARQLAAGRTVDLPAGGPAAIRVPTLVIHGEDDPLIRPSASRALAGQIPGARLVTYPGMGHGLPLALWPAVTEEISALIRQAVPDAADGPESIREAGR
jgi:pimeloyl-ACP methyl ester carboxylesterase